MRKNSKKSTTGMRITQQDLEILQMISDHEFLVPTLIMEQLRSNSLRYLQRRLSMIIQAGFLIRSRMPLSGHAYINQYLYRLSPQGGNILGIAGKPIPASNPYLQIRHLLVSELALLIKRIQPTTLSLIPYWRMPEIAPVTNAVLLHHGDGKLHAHPVDLLWDNEPSDLRKPPAIPFEQMCRPLGTALNHPVIAGSRVRILQGDPSNEHSHHDLTLDALRQEPTALLRYLNMKGTPKADPGSLVRETNPHSDPTIDVAEGRE